METRATGEDNQQPLSPRIPYPIDRDVLRLTYYITHTKTMTRVNLYAKLTNEEVNTLDRIAEDLGYPTRTDIITSLLQSLIYGKSFKKSTEEVDDISSYAERYNRLRDEFMNIIDKYAFPVVAMQGTDNAFRALKEDLKEWMYERCKAVPQEADMREWLKLYAILRKGKILQYRIDRMTETYSEEREGRYP